MHEPAEGVGRGVRVVVVDDDRDTVMTLGILLRSEGFDVSLVQDPAAVPAVVAEVRPQAVLMDIVMPGRNGLEVAAALRGAHGALCPLLIAVSGQTDAGTRARAQASGFNHFIAKPYLPATVLELLSSLSPSRPSLSMQ
jgi:two-component system OmpR family response regulator